MCFGSDGGDDSSKEIIRMQKQEAEESRQKEAARQDRIRTGLKNISEAFSGKPVMKDVNKVYDWSAFAAPTIAAAKAGAAAKAAPAAVAGLPPGFTMVQVPGKAVAATTPAKKSSGGSYSSGKDQFTSSGISGGAAGGGRSAGSNYGTSAAQTATAPAATWAIQGPDGRIYQPGENLGYVVQEETGEKLGGFDDKFYNDFKQSILDYYMPQVQEQLGKAANETLFRHARAGTLESSGQIGTAADLTKQNLLQEGKVQSQADTAATDLKGRVAKEQTALENQLYATEDPDIAANATLAAVENIAAVKPDTTPLGEIFQIAAIGGANAYKGITNARNKLGGYGSSGYGATTII